MNLLLILFIEVKKRKERKGTEKKRKEKGDTSFEMFNMSMPSISGDLISAHIAK